jgi:hypothetical protein
MAAYFSAESIETLASGREEVHAKFVDLRERYSWRDYKSDRGREHATHGLCRRLSLLVRCIDQVYEALPPEREDIPERHETAKAEIGIHSFVLNTFGCLDNLAWIWVYEKNVRGPHGDDLSPKSVGLGSKQVRDSFTDEFRSYLDGFQKWVDHLKDFRDSLAHRIPLYIPPYIVAPKSVDEYKRLEQTMVDALQRGDLTEHERLRSEQRKLVCFRPWMTHSYYEQAPAVLFHNQLLQDYLTVDELGRTMLRELDR